MAEISVEPSVSGGPTRIVINGVMSWDVADTFIQKADALKAKGIDTIACLSVNDAFVMGAWGDAQGAGDTVMMLADGNGDFTRAVGLEMDGSKFGMGKRSQRYSMVVDNGVVKTLNVEAPGAFEVSSADHMLAQL